MANETYYAWSNITSEATPDGKPATLVKVSEKVTQGNFTDDDWEYFVKQGVVRTTPYPDLSNYDGSPNDFYRAKLAQIGQLDEAPVQLTDGETKSLREAGLLPASAEEVTPSKK